MQLGERGIRLAQPLVGDVVFHVDHQRAGVVGTGHRAELEQLVFLALVELAIHQDHGLGSAVARVDRLRDQVGVVREPLSAGGTFLGEELRLVAQQQDDLVLHVEMRVVVVAVLVGAGSIAREHDLPGNRT